MQVMTSPTVTPIIPGENRSYDPNQFIAWCDKHISQPEECIMLKATFILALNHMTGLFERSLQISDIDRSIRSDAPILVRMDEVEYWFQAFDDIEKCFDAIEKNIGLNKHITLITSGSKGKILIPALKANFPNTFIDGYWMYVFCANMNMRSVGDIHPTNEWALDYEKNILMYNHENDLLTRMVLESARRFSSKADDLQKEQHLSNQEQELNENERLLSALQYLRWAEQMHERYKIISTEPGIQTFANINQRISDLERNLGLFHEASN
ncbi:unnamed protein product [Adineta ricciae]|uniref:Uncharacterized protein n=1 Tax=Adineta ricciae TaxID=249248 RepID=A0A814UXL8_ADIRI|nr:unnamed protein product [Adineta ricciae]CAF1180178.1 unnamed protein product [Adineta ricciae]